MIFNFALSLLAWDCSEADLGWALSSAHVEVPSVLVLLVFLNILSK